MMLKEEKAQTSLEYLLILGGAVAAATAIGLYLKSIPREVGKDVTIVYEEVNK